MPIVTVTVKTMVSNILVCFSVALFIALVNTESDTSHVFDPFQYQTNSLTSLL
jgi:hypothetical protein